MCTGFLFIMAHGLTSTISDVKFTYIHMYRGTITSVCRVGGWWWPAEKHMRWREWKIGFDTHLVTLHIAACPGVRCGCCCFQGDRQAGTEGQGGKQAATTTTVIMLLLFRNNKRRTKRENFYQFSCSLCSGCYAPFVFLGGWMDGWVAMGMSVVLCCEQMIIMMRMAAIIKRPHYVAGKSNCLLSSVSSSCSNSSTSSSCHPPQRQ